MVDRQSNHPSEAGAPYDAEVNSIYRQQLGASHAQSMAQSAKRSSKIKAEQAAPKEIPSMTAKPKPALMPKKPKVSLMNNRNKTDHVRLLICGVEKPKPAATEQAQKPQSSQSDYRQTYAWGEEAKEMVDRCD